MLFDHDDINTVASRNGGTKSVTERKQRKALPLVYSCSGCSSAAQMANDIALSLDRRGIAEMSCIAGVGGDVKPLVRVAKSGRPIIAIDGCPLQCVKSCLARHDIEPEQHFILSKQNVRKEFHSDYDAEQASELLEQIAAEVEAEE